MLCDCRETICFNSGFCYYINDRLLVNRRALYCLVETKKPRINLSRDDARVFDSVD